jgi:uncharacterized protein YjdB
MRYRKLIICARHPTNIRRHFFAGVIVLQLIATGSGCVQSRRELMDASPNGVPKLTGNTGVSAHNSERLLFGDVTVHLKNRRPVAGIAARLYVGHDGSNRTAGSLASTEVCDKGKPGENRRRKATRLQREVTRHASRAAETHYRGGRDLMRTFNLAVTGLALVTACSSYGTSVVEVTKPAQVAAVALTLPANTLVAGQTQRGVATVKDANGAPLSGRAVIWSSSHTSVATVDETGLMVAITPGVTVVTATSDGISGQNTLTVTAQRQAVAKVILAITPAAVAVGQTAHATPAVQDASGNPLTDRTVSYQSGNTAIATVSNTGDVSAVAPGSTSISATSEGITGSAPISVSAPAPIPVASVSVSPGSSTLQVGATVQLAATTRDGSNNVLTGRAVVWTSGNTAVASVSSSGLVTAVGAGSAQINAASEGQVGSATITVNAPPPPPPAPVASVVVSPGSSTLNINATAQLSATTRDANNNVLTGRVVSWSSANSSIASVNSATGLATAVGAGTVQITATSEGKTGSATIVVNAPAPPPPVPVASVTVAPASSTLNAGETVQLTATMRDANNTVLTGRVVSWSSATPSIASVNSNTGLVTAVAAGTVQITATSEGKTSSASVTVNAPTPPPPPPPSGSMEPAGMTKVSDRAFNSTTAIYTAGEDGWWDSDSGQLAIVQDATAPKSPSNVARMVFEAGMGGGYAPSTLERGVGGTTVYVAAWVKFSPNWQSHLSSVNKIIHMWINGANRLVITAASYDPTGPLTARISLQGIVSGGNNADGGISGTYESNVQFVRGQWHKIEVIAVANTSGASNGSVKLYIDGNLATQCSGIRFVTGAGSWDLISWSPTWGGTGDTVKATMYEYMDHFYISQK